MNFKKSAFLICTLLSVLLFQSSVFGQTTTTFNSGTAIIDMGSASPTVKNSLKPYGLIYALLKNNKVPVSVVINSTKVKDGIDFVYNGKSYKGGTFVVASQYITTAVQTVLNSWTNQGVVIDYANSTFTANVTYTINFVPKWVINSQYNGIAVGFLNAAGIPSSAYSLKNPADLGACDDIFIMPHADPTWASHGNLYDWNRNMRGSIWAGCHAVSVMENLVDPGNATRKMNFLTSGGLLPFTDHNPTKTPFTNQLPGDPVAQFLGKTDNAQLSGSETVYLPKAGSAWNAGAKIITTSPSQIDVPSLSAGAAVENIYGRGFDLGTSGYVAYQAAHNIGGSAADQIAAQRIFFNFSFLALNDNVPPKISVNISGIPTELRAGVTSGALNANNTGTGTSPTYQWTAKDADGNVMGTFSDATIATPTFTPSNAPVVTSSKTCYITCIATESCGRVSFDTKTLTIVPAAPAIAASNINLSIPDGCLTGSVTFNVFDYNVDANAGARTLVTVTGLANGTTTTSTNGTVVFTSNANYKGVTTGTYTIVNSVGTTASGSISITVGTVADAPSITDDAATALVNSLTVINVLANDKTNLAAANANGLYIRDISVKPAKGVVYIDAASRTLTYLSNNGQTGTDQFQYLACNTSGYCSSGTVSITLTDNCGNNVSGTPAPRYQLNQTLVPLTATLTASADAYMDALAANQATSYGTVDPLSLVARSTGGGTSFLRPLIAFGTSGGALTSTLPTTTVISSAVLSITASSAYTHPATSGNAASLFPLTINQLLKPFDEATVTQVSASNSLSWTTAGASSTASDITSTNSSTYPFVANLTVNSNDVIGATVTGIVQSWVTTPSGNYGVRINPVVGKTSPGFFFYSKDNGSANAPKLLINYYPCLTRPTDYAPAVYPDAATTSSALSVTISPLTNDVNYYGNTNIISKVNSLTGTISTANATITYDNSQIVYTPKGNFVGIDTLTYTVADQTTGITNTATIRVTVTRVAPTIVSDAASTNSNTAVTINVGANDVDLQGTLTAPTIVSTAANGTLSVVGNNIVYTPSTGFTGTDVFTYKRFGQASDACSTALSGTATVTVTVNNQRPVAVNDAVSTFACGPVNINLKTNDTDPENGTLTVAIVTNPTNGTLTLNADGTYKYTPTTNYTGPDQFTYSVTDNGSSVAGQTNLTSLTNATVTITVTGDANPNTQPVAVNDSDNILVNQSVYTNVLDNDSDPNNDPLTISITAAGLVGPTNGTIQLMPNKLVKYTPNNNFTGTDTYQYQITDTHPSCSGNGSLTAIATVTITVNAIQTTLSGTVWNDVDQSAAPGGVLSFTNIKTNTETGTNGNGSIYVYLVNSSNVIIDRIPVDVDGTYNLTNVPSSTSNLKLILSIEDIAIGGTLSTGSLPTGYSNTTPFIRSLGTTTTSAMGGYDFGIYTNPILVPGTITAPPAICGVSGTPGTFNSTAAASGGSITATGYNYQWQSSTVADFSSAVVTIAGATLTSYVPSSAITTTTYYRRMVSTNVNAAVYSNIVSVTFVALPTVAITPTTPFIAVNGSVTLTASGADTYAWTPSTGLSATNTAGVTATLTTTTAYTVTGTVSATGCANTASVTVTVVNPGTIGSDQANCGTFTPATLTSSADATGATGITYQWQSSTTSSSAGFGNIAGATATTYAPASSITITTYYRRVATAGGSSFNSNAITKTVNTVPSISITPTAPVIAVNGSATLTASGGDTYAWTPSTGLSATNTAGVTATLTTTTAYTVTGTVSATGCASTASVTVTVINPGTIGSNQANCGTFTPATLTSSADASGATGITYQWQSSTVSDFSSAVTTIAGATATTYAPASSITVTTYYRRVAGFGGSSFNSNTITKTVNAIPAVTAGSNSPICVGGALNLTSTGGLTAYSWTGPNGFNSTSQNPSINTITAAAGGTYTVLVTAANGCTNTISTTVTVNTLPTVAITPATSVIQLNSNASLTASGAGTYSWSPSTGLSATNTASVTATPLVTTAYTVTGTNTVTGCTNTSTITVTVINPGVIGSDQNGCGTFTPNAFTSTSDATGATGITYQWQSSTVADFSSSVTTIAGATAATYTPGAVTATTYFRRVASFGGSSFNSNTITATVKPLPVVTAGNNSPLCAGGTVSLTSTAGHTAYSWTGPNGYTSTLQNPSIVSAAATVSGIYTVQVTAANGCTATATTTVTVNALPTITITPTSPAILTYASQTLTASGANTYSWTPAANLSATNTATVTAGPLSVTGTYTVTGTVTSSGCTNTNNVTITVADVVVDPGVIGSSQAGCGTFTPTGLTSTTDASGAAGITYQWQSSTTSTSAGFTNIAGATAKTYSPSAVSVTTYYRRVAIANATSFNSNAVTVTSNTVPVTTAGSNSPVCVGAAINLSSGSGFTSYSWTGPNGFTSTLQNPAVSNAVTASAGTYTVQVTAANGCTATASTTVVVNALPSITVTPSAPSIILGNSVSLTASGANTYNWTPSTGLSVTNTATVTASPVTRTTYTVTGTNTTTGCVNSATVTVSVQTIDAIDDDYTGTEINGAKGGTTPVVLENDKLNGIKADISLVNLTLISNGGIAGLSFNASGALVVPANTFEGTYTVTYSICEKASPANCDPATVLIKIGRGLSIIATAICRNDVPYVQFQVTPNFTAGANPVTLTWLNGDKTVVSAQAATTNLALQAEVLWPGATVDGTGKGLDWPGWVFANGQWLQAADGFEKTRPDAYLVISVNPTDSFKVSYPPATPACNAAPPAIIIPIIPGTIGVDQTICVGSTPAAFSSVTAATGGNNTIGYQWQQSTDNITFTNITGAVSATYAPGAVSQKTYYRRAASATGNTTVYSNVVTVTTVAPPVIAGITGPCAMPKDSTRAFSVAPAVPTATNYVWTLPAGFTGSSTTNSINVKAGTANGTISVVPFNGSCVGNTVTYNVSVIDYTQVTISGTPVTASGNNNNPITVTVQLFDANGNKINCSGGIATLCSNSGVFSTVIDNNDGTYTAKLTSPANDVIICGSVGGVPVSKTSKVTFTGPQGGIKGNGPILATETPKITFTATAGRAPFTVIYRSAKSNKNDTLTNYTSGTPVGVTLIPSTTLYTLVSVIDANGERRDNNFNRDTATIIVVAPKVVITLHADPAKLEKDSSWSTKLTVKTKNIGDLDLTNSQAKLNLKDVFPNPVTFVLDSVVYSGRTIVPNKNYDGVQSTDLFARLNSQKQKVSSVESEETGVQNSGLSVDGLGDMTKAGVEIWTDKETGEETESVMYDGHSIYLFGPQSSLPVGVEADILLYLHLKPNGYTEPFVMQAVALGTGSTEGATALATSLSNDNNEISAHPDITKQGDPVPAVVNLFPTASIGLSLTAGTPVLQGNGTYNVQLSYKLKNFGNLNLQNVTLVHNLSRMIGSPSVFNVVGPIVSTGDLLVNAGYNGKTDTNLIAANSILGLKQEGTVQFTINITPNQLSSLYRLQATATGFSEQLNATVTDLSTNGTNPDPDGNNIPDERVLTLIVINQPIPPLVPGGIGILTNPSPRTTVPAKGYCGTATGVLVVSNQATTGGSGPYEYQWQSSLDNTVFANIAGATDSVYTTGTLATSTYFRRRVVSDNQVGYTNSVYVQIYAVTKPAISASGPLALPQNGSVTLTSTPAVSYAWSNSATTRSIAVTVATVGSYTVTATDANGCISGSDPVKVTPPPPVTIDAVYIIGASSNPANSGVQVTGFPTAKLNYYILSSGGTLIPVPVLPLVIGVYTYYVSQTINGIESVIVPYKVTMLDPAKVADIQKVLSKPPVLQSEGSYLLSFTFLASNLRGELLDSVKIKDDLTKVFPATSQFQIMDIKASGKLKANTLFNGNSQTELLADGSQLPGLQTDSVEVAIQLFPNGFSGTLNNTAIQTVKSPYGTFSVTSNDPTVGNGISVRNPTKFFIPAVDIFIPSGFSPNRDGVNDLFVITRPFGTTINLEIYNRWGNAVYKAPDYKNQWDGRGNQPNNILGEELPDGTYYYIVTATDTFTGKIRKFAGFITLKR